MAEIDRETAPGPDAAEQGGDRDLLAVLEAMLFASSEPLSPEEIGAALPHVEPDAIEGAFARLEAELARPERGLRLERVAGGWRLVTCPDVAEPLRTLFRFRNRRRLTPAALEVLAIVAYAQPITAPEIQQVRGTDPAYALRVLLDRKLVRMVGRKRVVGRPILYGTTREFLLHFGLDSLDDLPPVEAYSTRVVRDPGTQNPLFASDAAGEDDAAEPVDDGDAPPAGGDAADPSAAGYAAALEAAGGAPRVSEAT